MAKPLNEVLTPDNGFIFRITHRENLAVLLRRGVHCRNSPQVDPDFVEIGNPEIIGRRQSRDVPVPPGGTLADYVPFYFTPCTPMLYNIVSGWNGMRQRGRAEIVVLVSSLSRATKAGCKIVISDRNATLLNATFVPGSASLYSLPWDKWRNRDFKRDPNDPSSLERYQAEALVFQHLPSAAIDAIITYDRITQVAIQQLVSAVTPTTRVACRPDWYP